MQRRNQIRIDLRFAAVALVLIAGHFWFPKFGEGTGRDSYSTGEEGKKAFFELMRLDPEGRGYRVRRNTAPLARILDRNRQFLPPEVAPFPTQTAGWQSRPLLCLLGPARYPNAAEWSKLLDWVDDGGRLLIAARRDDPAFVIEKLDIRVRPLKGRLDTGGSAIRTTLIDDGELAWRSRGDIAAPLAARPLLQVAGTTQAVRRSWGQGSVVVVATDFPFTNHALTFADHSNAVLAIRLLEAVADDPRKAPQEIIIDEALNVSGTPKVVGLLLNPAFKPLSLQLLIGLLLFAWWRRRRFGPLLPETVAARQNVVDHTDAVGTLLYRTRDGTAALRAYLRQLFGELNMKMHRGREERVIEPLAYKMGKDPELLKRLLRRAVKASKVKRLDRRIAAQLLRQLAIVRRAAQQSASRGRQKRDASGKQQSLSPPERAHAGS